MRRLRFSFLGNALLLQFCLELLVLPLHLCQILLQSFCVQVVGPELYLLYLGLQVQYIVPALACLFYQTHKFLEALEKICEYMKKDVEWKEKK